MTYLRNSILATIAYYDVLDYPLTLVEVYNYLINPSRIAVILDWIEDIKLTDIADELENLTKIGLVNAKNGFYFLNGRDSLYALRIEKQKIADQKWKKFLRCSYWLVMAPYLRGIFASGSLALENTNEESDFDVLIIAKHSRLYTCRFFLWLISSIRGMRRKRFENIAPDKLCFNHYITDKNLNLEHVSLFNAQTYANLKPVYISNQMFNEFCHANIWINNFVFNFKPCNQFIGRNIKISQMFLAGAGLIEFFLDLFGGQWLEDKLKKYQQKRIRNNPVTYESGGRIIFNDRELEFHPRSFEAYILKEYKVRLRKLGIFPCIDEKDSGLVPPL